MSLGSNNIEVLQNYRELSMLGVIKYNVITCNDASGSFCVVQNLKKFHGKSGQIISSLDTTGNDLVFSGTWSSTANQDVTILCDCYAQLDMVLINVDVHILHTGRYFYHIVSFLIFLLPINDISLYLINNYNAF